LKKEPSSSRNYILHLKEGSTPSPKHSPTKANQISSPWAEYQIISRCCVQDFVRQFKRNCLKSELTHERGRLARAGCGRKAPGFTKDEGVPWLVRGRAWAWLVLGLGATSLVVGLW